MGNSVSVNGESEENPTSSIIEDLEENDCFYISVSEEAVKTNKDPNKYKKLESRKQLSTPKENATNAVVKEDSNYQKDLCDGGSKSNNNKKPKAKQALGKKDSTDSVSSVNGPLSPPANMVKSNQNSMDNVGETESSVQDQKNSDLDMGPKKEEVFVEVKKKKKRVAPKENIATLATSNAPFVPNHFYARNGNGVLGQSVLRNNGFQRQPRSSTPLNFPSCTTTSQASSTNSTTYTTNATTTPIVSSSNTTLSVSSNSSSSSGVEHHIQPPRDLSPSAFPVLEGHNLPPPGTEARRNSCGDATDLLVESKSLCDSDRESVKSLPATSHMYPVSYARMAAGSGPRHINSSYPESIASPSSESGLGWQNSSNSSVTHTPTSSCHTTSPGEAPTPHTPERKASNAVWKGSPRERRHSIGSSPAEEKISSSTVEECSDTNIVNRNRQKSGSQEFLNRDMTSVTSTVSTEVSTSVAKVFHISESSSSLQSDSLSEDLMGSGSTQTSRDIASTSQQSYSNVKATVSQSSYATPVTSAPTSTAPSKQASEDLSVVSSQPMPSQKNIGNEASSTGVSKKTISQATKSGSSSSTSSRTSTAASGGNNTKSVVFLDKRVTSSSAQSLGITFGFDSTFDSSLDSVGKEEIDRPEKNSNVIKSGQVKTATVSSASTTPAFSSSPSSSGQPTGSQLQSKPHNIPQSVSPVPSNKCLSSASAQQSSDISASDKKVPKGPHIEHLSNGLIIPPHSQQPQHQQGRGQPATNSSIVSNNAPPQARTAGSKPVVGPGLEILFSPNFPPPPLPQVNILSNPGPSVTLPPQGSSPAPGSTMPDSHEFRKLSCMPDVSQPPPVPTLKAAVAQPGLALPPQPPHQHHSRQQQQQSQQHKPVAFPVVYGLRIKPSGGCGKFFFIPPPNPVKKLRPKEVPEASGFLKRSKLCSLFVNKTCIVNFNVIYGGTSCKKKISEKGASL